MKLPEIQQQTMQARMSLIVRADNYDRLFAGAVFDEVEKGVLYCFARSEDLAAEIEDRFALHISISANQIVRVPVEFVQVPPDELRQLS
jgi:hypothetical protein